jgi:thiol-disulfide isomerase/thioredoxin
VWGLLVVAAMLAVATGPWTVRAEVDRLQPWTGATPPLELRDLAGTTHSLHAYLGRVVLVNFWATWCDPCRDEMASIQRLRERLSGQPFIVLAVNYGESASRIETFVRQMSIGFPVLLDRSQEASRAWRVRVLPASFLVGPDGRIRYHVIGEIDWAADPVVAAIRRLIRSGA